MALEDIRKNRIEKLESLKGAGISVYPHASKRTHTVEEVREQFDELTENGTEVRVAGRIRGWRGHGGATFVDLEDGTGSIQAYLRENALGKHLYELFEEHFDTGDFAEVRGTLFTTKQGEQTVDATDIAMLTKSLRPLPEKWHGLKDTEERYRRRYLDLLYNKDVREAFETKAAVTRAVRDFLDENDFIEVETPILQPMYGGAEAAPFKTHLNAFDLQMYLRIAPELYLKRLIAGGFERVYEIGRVFRNEGVDRSHNPDFTMLEFYWAYADYKDMMEMTEQLFAHFLREVFGSTTITYKEEEIDFTPPWQRIEYGELLQRDADADVFTLNREGLLEKARELDVPVEEADDKYGIADAIYKKYCLPNIREPTFVIHHPSGSIPLAKPLKDDPEKLGSVQGIAAGWELVKAYSELNDPQAQKQVFEEQEQQFVAGDEEAHRLDTDFVEALEYGMPPTAGFGMGMDRLTALLTGAHSLREVILFPTMKPRE